MDTQDLIDKALAPHIGAPATPNNLRAARAALADIPRSHQTHVKIFDDGNSIVGGTFLVPLCEAETTEENP